MTLADATIEASGGSASPLTWVLIILVALLVGGSISWMRWRTWKRGQDR